MFAPLKGNETGHLRHPDRHPGAPCGFSCEFLTQAHRATHIPYDLYNTVVRAQTPSWRDYYSTP